MVVFFAKGVATAAETAHSSTANTAVMLDNIFFFKIFPAQNNFDREKDEVQKKGKTKETFKKK